MGNYEQLKKAISDVIKTNGNQEITGAILQNVLQSMVTSLGSGATFMGVATPSTNPGTPDTNVFYIAASSGVYVNFDGLTIGDNEIGVFYTNGNQWVGVKLNIPQSDYVERIKSKIYYHSLYASQATGNKILVQQRVNKAIKELYISRSDLGNHNFANLCIGNVQRRYTSPTGTMSRVILYDITDNSPVLTFFVENEKADGLCVLTSLNSYCLIDWSEITDGAALVSVVDAAYVVDSVYVSNINNFPVVKFSKAITGLTIYTKALNDMQNFKDAYNIAAISWVDDDFNLDYVQNVVDICNEVACKCDFGLIPTATGGTGEYPLDSIYSIPEAVRQFAISLEQNGFHIEMHPYHRGWYNSQSAGTYQGREWCEQSLIKTIRCFKENGLLNSKCVIYPGVRTQEQQAEVNEMTQNWLNFGVLATGNYNDGIVNRYGLNRLFISFDTHTKTWYKNKIDEAVAKGAWLILGTHSWNFKDTTTVDETTNSIPNLKEIIAYANSKVKIQPISFVYEARKVLLELYKL